MANRSIVSVCQDQRRFSISDCSGASGSGRTGWIVKRRMALTLCDLNVSGGQSVTTTRVLLAWAEH